MKLPALAILVLTSVPCVAQMTSKEFDRCDKAAKDQTSLNICAAEESKRADKQLNEVYAKLLLKLSDDTLATTKVKTAERAWITYRDAYIDAMFPAEDKQLNYGTMYPMEVGLWHAYLTQEHVKELKHLLNEDRL